MNATPKLEVSKIEGGFSILVDGKAGVFRDYESRDEAEKVKQRYDALLKEGADTKEELDDGGDDD